MSQLTYWKNALENYGFDCELLQADDVIKYPRLNVSYGTDERKRPRTLEIREEILLLPADLRDPADAHKPQKETFIQVFIALPFLVNPESFGELSRLLMLINRPLEFPGFALDERSQLVYFRYNLTTHKGKISARLIISLIGTIHLLVDSLYPQIEAVAYGASIKDTLTTLVRGVAA